MASGNISLRVLFLSISHTLCISFLFLGCILLFILGKMFSVPNQKCPAPVRSYKYFLVSVWVFSLVSYVCVILDIFFPVRLFFLGNILIHVLFLNVIIMKDTDLLYGGKWLQETQIPNSKVFQILAQIESAASIKKSSNVKAYLEEEQCYKNPCITRERAAAIGTNGLYYQGFEPICRRKL